MKPIAIEDSNYSTSTTNLTSTGYTLSVDSIIEADPTASCFAIDNTSLAYWSHLCKEIRTDSESVCSRRVWSID